MQTSPRQTDRTRSVGFTLMEVLVALVILAVISTMLARILQGSLRAQQLQHDQAESLTEHSHTLSLQFSGELEEPIVTLEPIEEEE